MLTQFTRHLPCDYRRMRLLGIGHILAMKSCCFVVLQEVWCQLECHQGSLAHISHILPPGRKYVARTVYSALFRKGFKSIQHFIWFSHIFWHIIQKCWSHWCPYLITCLTLVPINPVFCAQGEKRAYFGSVIFRQEIMWYFLPPSPSSALKPRGLLAWSSINFKRILGLSLLKKTCELRW